MYTLLDKIKQVGVLENGNGIQYLLNESHIILGNPLLMHDMDYNLMGYTENVVTDDPIWNEFVENGKIGHKTIEFFKEESIIDTVANAKTIALLISDIFKYDVIIGKICNKDKITVANIYLIACEKPLEANDFVTFEALCKIFSKEINANEFYQNYGNLYQENMINKLIEGAIDDKRLYSERVANIYEGLKVNLYVAVADISKCDPKYTKVVYFKDLFKQMMPEFKYSIYFNYIIIIISSDEMMLDEKKDLNKLNKLFKQKNIYAGISSCFENIYELSKYYSDAVSILNLGIKSNTNQRIFLCSKK